MYEIVFSAKAQEGLAMLKANEPKYFQKAVKLLNELAVHPRTGTGKPKQLAGDRAGQWRRKISNKHRLVYEIHDHVVEVYVLLTWGHYDDK